MGRYNLLDEKWIVVFTDEGQRKVSLLELFEHSQEYRCLAGEMKTQDFAVMRILEAVLHTVFSRYRSDGTPYDYFEVDPDTMKQIGDIDEYDLNDYRDDLYDTWFELWNEGRFPKLVGQYLEIWREHFYLYNDAEAFMQVSKEQIEKDARGGSEICGKNINRLISQSNNKIAFFSPKHDIKKNRECITNDEAARWLITFHGYCGTGDKRKVNETKLTCSKGWLFDLGGIYLEGANLFETLMLNCALALEDMSNLLHRQIPAWERTSEENIQLYFSAGVDNVTSLYTAWGRAIYIDPDYEEGTPFSCFVGKIPEINHVNEFLETMTYWNYNQSGSNKDKYTPRKHRPGQAMWRNFGSVMGVGFTEAGATQRRAGVLNWLDKIHSVAGDIDKEILLGRIRVCAVSMQDDGNATSWAPVDEIYDEMSFDDMVLTDSDDNGWMVRINGIVEWTKKAIYTVLKPMLRDLSEIRGMDPKDLSFINKETEQFYYLIDQPFRSWLDGISVSDSKEEKEKDWKKDLKKLLSDYGDKLLSSGPPRDYRGIETGGGDKKIIKNNATVFHDFMRRLNKQFV